jgi:hypothetical protein
MGLPTRQAGVRFLAAKSVGASDNEAMAMTEHEWLACIDPAAMSRYIDALPESPCLIRKSRLAACAFARQVWHLLTDERSRQAILVAEKYAESEADLKALRKATDAAYKAGLKKRNTRKNLYRSAADVAYVLHSFRASNYPLYVALQVSAQALRATQKIANMLDENPQENLHQCNVIRDIFGNPFRPITLNPVWRTSNVTALAQSIYDDRAFDRLPILADALEDAGCDNADILNHCRQPGEHVRGCWVVDLLLGKE